MGYDMSTLITPQDEAQAVARAREAVDAAIRERDSFASDDPHCIIAQEKVNRLLEAMRQVDLSYFRLNIWGMGRYRNAMLDLGMAYEGVENTNWPDWPRQTRRIELVAEAITEEMDPSEYLAKYGDSDREKEPARGEEVAVAKAYFDQTDMLKREHPAGGTTIPLHKLGSNDGWIVTPGECLEALAAWYRASEDEREQALSRAGVEDRDYWDGWLDFLQIAAHRDGFEVC